MDGSGKILICNVLFLDIVDYHKLPVAEQIAVKERFNAYLKEAICSVPPEDRIILDTGNGAAINFLGDVEDALRVAITMRKLLRHDEILQPSLKVRTGINLGPVRLVRDLNGRANIIGDGINSSQRVMGFANPGQILVSRPYYEAVSNLSSKYSGLFHYEGSRTDKHVRAYEVYAIGYPREAFARTTMAIVRSPKTAVLLFLIAAAWVEHPALIMPFHASTSSRTANRIAPSSVPAAPSASVTMPVVTASPANPNAPLPAGQKNDLANRNGNRNQAHAGKAILKIYCEKGTFVLVDGRPRGTIRKSELTLQLDEGKHLLKLINPPRPGIYTKRVILTSNHVVRVSPREFCAPLK